MVELTTHLRGAGLRADTNLPELNTPGVWVTVAAIQPDLLSGGGHVQLHLYVVTANAQPLDVLDMLDEATQQLLDLVDSDGDLVPATVVSSDGSSLPAYRVTVTVPYLPTGE